MSIKLLNSGDELPIKTEENPSGPAKQATKKKGSASVKPRTQNDDSPLKTGEKKPAPPKTAKRRAVSKNPQNEKKPKISRDEVTKPIITSNTGSDSTDQKTSQEQHKKSTWEKTASNTTLSPLQYGVESGEIIANQLIRANRDVCMFWLDAIRQFRKTNLEKMVLVEETGQMADQMVRGLLEAGTDHAYNTVGQAADIAKAGI